MRPISPGQNNSNNSIEKNFISAVASDFDQPDERVSAPLPVSHIAELQRRKLERGAQMHLLHWLVVILSIILTLGAWYIAREQSARAAEERFTHEAEQVVELVSERLALYENALWGAVSLIDSNYGEITYPQWYDYANSLHIDKVNPGINGLGVIHNVKPEELQDYLDRERIWRPDFKIHPRHDQPELWPITYIEPLLPNIRAVGLDIAFESNRYDAIRKARDTGQAQITGPITLVQDSRNTPGFLFYTPFYEKGFKPDSKQQRSKLILGVTYAPFIMFRFMQGTLASDHRLVSVVISDAGETLYSDADNNLGRLDDVDPEPLYSLNRTASIYGREWNFKIDTNLSFRQATSNYQPAIILVGGIVIDSLLLAVFIFLSRANQRALRYADDMTSALQLRSIELEKSNRDLQQFAYVASHDLKSPLSAIHKLIDWIEEDLGEGIPDSSKQHLDLLRGRSARMSRLIDDLLDYSRVGSFDYTQEQVDLNRLVSDIFQKLGKPDSFSIETEQVTLDIPRVPLEIVLRNLISNAIEHHDRDEDKISVGCEIGESCYRISIADNGPGIAPELQGKALKMFQCLQSRDNAEGSGMGLAIARRIAEHYRGSLDIESDGHRGTTIVINWPTMLHNP